jgi:hypothetical protein
MLGHNLAFKRDPFDYITKVSVNNLRWFRKAVVDTRTLGPLSGNLGLAKFGQFDLQIVSQGAADFNVIGASHASEPSIRAYWCPFIQGAGLPGWVDVPKSNPASPFVFTAAMNGCRLVICNRSATHYRVFHHQHPDDRGGPTAAIWAAIVASGGEIVSHFGWDEYGLPPGSLQSPNSFTFLYYRNGTWNFMSQPQTFDMHTLAVSRIPGRAIMRSV